MSLIDTLQKLKSIRRDLPANGWIYFTSRFLDPKGRHSLPEPHPEILINYIGQFQQLSRSDSIFKHVSDPVITGSDDDPSAIRNALIDIEVSIVDSQLLVNFIWSQRSNHQDRLADWVLRFQDSVESIINLDIDDKYVRQYTIADFPLLLQWDVDFDELMDQLRLSNSRTPAIDDVYPCSPMQSELISSKAKKLGYYEGTWFWKLDRRNSHIDSIHDLQRVKRAWLMVVQRHHILRTVFLKCNGRWIQTVLTNPNVKMETLPPGDRPPLLELQEVQIDLNFLSTQDLPHQITLLPCTDGSVYCRLDISHAIMDGAAMEHVLQDWTLAYADQLSFSKSIPTYSRFISSLLAQPRAASRQYWQDYLANNPTCYLETNGSRQGMKKRVHKMHKVDLPLNLHEFCASYGFTTASLIKAIWSLVLRDSTGAKEVLFGYLTSGRQATIAGADRIVGPLFNTLVTRIHLGEVNALTPLLQIVQRVQEDYVASLPFQDFSYAELRGGDWEKREFNTLVNYRRTTLDKRTSNSDWERPYISFTELECWDPMDYAIVIEAYEVRRRVEVQLSYWEDELASSLVKELAITFGRIASDILNSE